MVRIWITAIGAHSLEQNIVPFLFINFLLSSWIGAMIFKISPVFRGTIDKYFLFFGFGQVFKHVGQVIIIEVTAADEQNFANLWFRSWIAWLGAAISMAIKN